MSPRSNPGPLSEPADPPAQLPRTQVPPVAARVRELQVLADKVQRQLARTLGIGPTDLAAVEHLLLHGPMSASELARRMEMSTAATTHVIDRLSAAGHAHRRRDPHDRRRVTVAPDAESVARVFEELRPIIDGVVALVERRTPEEQAVVADFLGDVVGFYEELLERDR
ncbi:MarR family transcriptional regulator [Auraticoccus sp. F435]|uniref:MarR family transcriptional regulator n=1 Tax=Auraticoccus cholistanensis TaxID=2656650 RepID=A0A6A9UR10_9ACTN|nr:MarR family winged helix-turn-helix transcriptional regulator [Auraticoccus cholistanensis]MVA75346.1 MarR family transcriptional regulator [Auraticoccus cholistanensis]